MATDTGAVRAQAHGKETARRLRTVAALCAACALGLPAAAAWAAPVAAAPATSGTRAEVKPVYGVNTVKLGKLSLRIVKGMIGNGTASSFDTFTLYLVPAAPGEAWMQVTAPGQKGLGYNFRNYESGDANMQSIGFYVEANHLYAVQATKVGAAADANGSRKTPFDFEVSRFNEDEDIPMFHSERKLRSKGQYVDASEAVAREFFNR
ncbi:hypothetical protein HH212_20065 [Massilia forsythiae]|uniref:Uncharacterized protein n=1 Tax=Massilia forsythiae TaxID=2728020 RepID=A0A7Z2W059_9BURK|nr:hypothetical protein [Massilia forsythiae]QJE02030.1 hypothetical protein HH212_20065 [Massilia forsythiae]